MVKLAILLTHHYRLLSMAAILDVFESVNQFYESRGESAFFQISLLTTSDTPEIILDRYQSNCLHTAPAQDVIFIPAFSNDEMPRMIALNQSFIPWLVQQHTQGAALASFCTGAFLLAATGLLNGHKATTHVNATQALAMAFPHVQVQTDAIVTHADRLYTSGGATSSFHLMLHILDHYCGKEVVIHTAKLFAIDMDRMQQSYFSTFKPTVSHGDPLIKLTQQRIESSFQQAGTIEEIIQDIPASRRNVVRRFKQATGITPIEYLQRTRIEAAKKMLERSNESILDVMLRCGYNDLKSFRQLFKKNTGMTPTAYRDKFNPAKHAYV